MVDKLDLNRYSIRAVRVYLSLMHIGLAETVSEKESVEWVVELIQKVEQCD